MKNLWKVARFELRYHLRRPATWLFAALMIGQGVWYSWQLAQQYANDQLFVNSAANAYLVLASMGVGLAVVAVLLAGQSLTKDLDHRTAPYLYAMPISDQSFFVGRFLGTFLTVLGLAVFYLLGIAAMPLLGNLARNPGQIGPRLAGPVPVLALVQGFLELTVLQVFTVVSVAFSLTVLFRSIRGAYLMLFLMVLYFLLAGTPQSDGSPPNDLLLLLDPFGVGMVRDAVLEMLPADQNAGPLPFPDMLFINRLLWLALSLGLLREAEKRFSFAGFGTPKSESARFLLFRFLSFRREEESALPGEMDSSSRRNDKKRVDDKKRASSLIPANRILRLTRLEFRELTRQTLFRVVVGLLALLTVLFATVFNQNPDFPELLTTARITAIRHPLGLFTGLFLLIFTGELIHRERTVGLWAIMDALPRSVSVRLLPKLLALAGGAALLTGVLFGVGLAVQLASGFPVADIDWSLYALDFVVDGWWPMCQFVALGAVVSVLLNNRIAGHLVSVALLVALWTVNQAVTNNSVWLFGFLPGSKAYSDLIGYGAAGALWPGVSLAWWGVAGLFVILALLGWQRGVPATVAQRVQEAKRRFSGRYALAGGVLGAMLLAGIGWKQQIALNNTELNLPPEPISYQTKTTVFQSADGRAVPVSVVYHHDYQADKFLSATVAALQTGERLFGPYPFQKLRVVEIPQTPGALVTAKPGQIMLPETEGWTANPNQPDDLDYLDYLATREVMNQWLVHGLKPASGPGAGFLKTSLAEYLALQTVSARYGPDRLRQRLAQRADRYTKGRAQCNGPEPTLLQAETQTFVARDRAALVLTSIGQIWGDSALSRCIGQFYRIAVGASPWSTAIDFDAHLSGQLPDSLRYLTGYLTHRYRFGFHIGRISRQPSDIGVAIYPEKTDDDALGNRTDVLPNDLVPVVLLDGNGHEVYRTLVRPDPMQPGFRLPLVPGAQEAAVDPLGAWVGATSRDKRKVF